MWWEKHAYSNYISKSVFILGTVECETCKMESINIDVVYNYKCIGSVQYNLSK